MRVMGERVAHGAIGVDAACAELDAKTDRILEKRRWMLDRKGRA
jgi:multiple sugar transport system substrate-binding protein